jgi:putative PIG3 family NAD(P)H quinone oxidoreductase
MKAVYIAEFGYLEGLDVRDVPEPGEPTGTEVLVEIHAAGLNRADLLPVKGSYPPPDGYSPNIPGLEFAGEVTAVGSNVETWRPGARVFGITAGEAQAEYLITDASLLASIPEDLGYVEAAAVPEAFITAHDACFTQGELKNGDTVLIHAIGSGVGLAALQLAKANGATVIGTSRTADKLETCREYGLDLAIGPDAAGLRVEFAEKVKHFTNTHGADVILDLVGADYFEQNLDSLAVKGRLILVGLTSGSKAEFDLGRLLKKRAKIIGTVLRARSLEEKGRALHAFAASVVPLLAAGKVKPVLDRVFPIDNVVEAYRYLASNESFGKVVLEF